MMRAIDDAGQDDQPDYSEGGPKQDQERSGVRTFKDLGQSGELHGPG